MASRECLSVKMQWIFRGLSICCGFVDVLHATNPHQIELMDFGSQDTFTRHGFFART